MPSSDFLLYLVIACGILYHVMSSQQNANQPIQYKYVPVYKQSDRPPDRPHDRPHDRPPDRPAPKTQQKKVSINIRNQSGQSDYPQGYPPDYPPDYPPVPPVLPVDPLRRFDYDAIYDEFTPPFRRSYYDDHLIPELYPMYSRGPPGRFRKVGMLIAQGVATNDKYKFMNMMGREKYVGRDYEYYATSTDSEHKIKFYIDTKGREIRDCDIVTIPELEGYVFKFSEDPDLSPRYDPYAV
jgi:hypothetical protein